MAHFEQLPDASTVTDELRNTDLTSGQQQKILDSVAYLLSEHAEYYKGEHQKKGEKQDLGAREALEQLATDFRAEARYAAVHEGPNA